MIFLNYIFGGHKSFSWGHWYSNSPLVWHLLTVCWPCGRHGRLPFLIYLLADNVSTRIGGVRTHNHSCCMQHSAVNHSVTHVYQWFMFNTQTFWLTSILHFQNYNQTEVYGSMMYVTLLKPCFRSHLIKLYSQSQRPVAGHMTLIPFHWPSLSRLVSRDIKTVRSASAFTPLTLVLHSGKNPQFRTLALSLGGALVLWWVSLICPPRQIYEWLEAIVIPV